MGKVSMPQGKGSQLHNRREYEKIGKPIPDNIDVSKSSENITLVDKDIKQAYQEIFGEALEKYNAKQKRADRKIEDYCDHIKKSKNGEKLFYEDVVQWGSKEDFQKPETRERAKEALVQYVKGFEERNPNLKLIGAYTSLTNIVKAVGMLKYDKEDGYKVDGLTKKQERLIDGVAEYGAKWAKEDGFPEMAEDMEKHIGISKGIADTIEPPRRQISRGWDMEL